MRLMKVTSIDLLTYGCLLCLPISVEYELKYITYAFQQIAIRGINSCFSFLKYLASNKASSLIKVLLCRNYRGVYPAALLFSWVMPFFAHHSCALTLTFKLNCRMLNMMLFKRILNGLFGLLRSFFKGLIIHHYVR
jgi:hypothetical protein